MDKQQGLYSDAPSPVGSGSGSGSGSAGPPAYPYPYPSASASATIPPPPASGPAGQPTIRQVRPLSTLTGLDTLYPSDSASMVGGHQQHPHLRQSDATLAHNDDHDDDYNHKNSAYNDPYASPYAAQHHNDDYDDENYYPRKPSYGHTHQDHDHDLSSAHLPLNANRGPMGYAEDEDDEARQLQQHHHPSDPFSSQYHPGPEAEMEDGSRGAGAGAGAGPGAGPAPGTKLFFKGAGGGSKVEQQAERRRAGVFRQKYGVLAFLLAIVYVIIFIVELVQSKARTGQAFQTKPQVQPMLGPPFEFFIAFPLGARFVPCMRNVPTHPTTTLLPCLNATTTSVAGGTTSELCPLWEVCGMKSAEGPYQSYRFVTAIFIHAGVIHLLFNILAQLTLVVQVEKILGTPAFALIYFAGGIGGNLLGGNFGLMSPALGASGAVYTAVGVEMTDLLLNWKFEARRKTRLTISIVFAIIGLALGLLPGLDNFSHIGGFICGILGGLAFGPSIHPSAKHRVAVWVIRLVSLGLMVGFLVGLATNFFRSEDPAQACRWCRYLSCLPVFSQCKNDGLTTTTTGVASSTSATR
ncbi:unnamed protein product [Tilletia controversa]|nr:unnamed protein product [Tilletia controversa]